MPDIDKKVTVQKQQGDAWETIGKGIFTAYFDEISSFLALEELDTIAKKVSRSVDSAVAAVKEKPWDAAEVALQKTFVWTAKETLKILFPVVGPYFKPIRLPETKEEQAVKNAYSAEKSWQDQEAIRKRDVYQFWEFADICRISRENHYFYIFERNGETYRLNCSTAYRAKQVFEQVYELFHQKAPDRWDRSSETEE